MKKILFLLATLPMIVFTACSSDNDDNNNENQLIGTWVEDTEDTFEVLHKQFNSDHTGYHWATDQGAIDEQGKVPFTWSATNSQITLIFKNETAIYAYAINGNHLKTTFDGEVIHYTKQ